METDVAIAEAEQVAQTAGAKIADAARPTVAAEPEGLIEIEIPSRVDLVAVVRMIVAAATNAVDAIRGDRLDDLRWVTSEATTNAIEANMANEGGRVVVRCEVTSGLVRLAVSDEGPGMPEPMSIPDITDPERLRIEGAFGIPLMQHLSSALSFHSGQDGTTVEMELHQ